MNASSSKKQIALAVTAALALGLVSAAAVAQTSAKNSGYVLDSQGQAVKSGTGLCWRTGYWTPSMATAECDPDLVKTVALPIPAAPKQAVAAAPPPPTQIPAAQRVKLAADTLFDFDKATLRPAGRQALDDFISQTRDINPEVIVATGHADRFGSDSFNQHLSEQRVAAVKEYLLTKGIEPNRIYTEGKGEMQPITKADECLGAKSAKVIACLQPDRRVDIEVVGTRKAN